MLIRGDRGLVSASFGRRSARQLEAARRAIRHHLARQGQLWILSFPQRPITAKPAEVRMGGGGPAVEGDEQVPGVPGLAWTA